MEDKTYRLDEVEDAIAESDEFEFGDADYPVVGLCDSMRLELEPVLIHIPALDLLLRSGAVSVLDEDTGEFSPDSSVTAIYDGNDPEPGHWLYYEQDGFVTTVHNYMRAMGIAMPEGVESEYTLECRVVPSRTGTDE